MNGIHTNGIEIERFNQIATIPIHIINISIHIMVPSISRDNTEIIYEQDS